MSEEWGFDVEEYAIGSEGLGLCSRPYSTFEAESFSEALDPEGRALPGTKSSKIAPLVPEPRRSTPD